MTTQSVVAIVEALNQAGVRYLIAGGLAVVAHGFLRFTADVDLILAPDEANLTRAVGVLKALDYRPHAPVPLEAFVDPAERARWAREKGLVVFSTSSPRHPATEIDLFAEPPLDFGPAFHRSARIEIAPGVLARFVSRSDLIEMKRAVGRPQDLEDIRNLERLGDPEGP